MIIFDEIDAICKQRGSVQSGAGVHDTLVNQLLTKIDGVDSLNNILLIGMTNRRALSQCLLLMLRQQEGLSWGSGKAANVSSHMHLQEHTMMQYMPTPWLLNTVLCCTGKTC